MASTSRPVRTPAILSPTDPCSPIAYPLSATALLLMDYHSFIVGMIKDPEQQDNVISNVKSLLKWARENDVLTIHALVDTKGSPPETSKLRARWSTYQQMLDQNPSLADLYSEFAPSKFTDKELIVTRKPGLYSVLESNGMKSILETNRIKSLVMAGIATGGCTLSTARASPDQGFITTVVEDGCMDPTEGVHQMLCEHILTGSAHVVDTKTWISEAESMKP